MTDLIGVVEDCSMEVVVEMKDAGPQGPQGPQGPPGPAGTTNYNLLENRPSIQSIELIGNRTFEDLGIIPISQEEIVNLL